MADFTKSAWRNKSDPAYNATTDPHLTADQLNRMEAGIYDAVYKWASGTLAARPPADAAHKNNGYFATDDNGGTAYVCFDGATWTKIAPGVSALGGHTIMDEGVALTSRAKLDFAGAGVTVTDDAANGKTLVTVPGGGGGGGGAPWIYDAEVSGVASVNLPSLSGDADIEYEIIVDGVLTTAVNRNITARPNGQTVTTSNAVLVDYRAGGAAPATELDAFDDVGLIIARSYAANSRVQGVARLEAKTGRKRAMRAQYTVMSDGTTRDVALGEVASIWTDTTTAIASLTIDFGGGTFTGRVRVCVVSSGGGGVGSWTAVAAGTNWTQHAASAPLAWRSEAGIARLRGRIERTASFLWSSIEPLFTLPAAARPLYDCGFTCLLHDSANHIATVEITASTGVVKATSGDNATGVAGTWIDLGAIAFPTT